MLADAAYDNNTSWRGVERDGVGALRVRAAHRDEKRQTLREEQSLLIEWLRTGSCWQTGLNMAALKKLHSIKNAFSTRITHLAGAADRA